MPGVPRTGDERGVSELPHLVQRLRRRSARGTIGRVCRVSPQRLTSLDPGCPRWKMEIVRLAREHEAALRDFLADFSVSGEGEIPAYFADPDASHAELVDAFAKQSRGEGLPEGWVPGTTYFLVDDGRILGVANLRHRLTDFLRQFGGHVGYSVRPSERGKGHATRLLSEVKARAREMGIERLLVTCGTDNAASARVIEKCGGVLEDQRYVEAAGKTVHRFWIDL